MASFANLPYVYELARIHTGNCAKKFSMTYEEYVKYAEIFDNMPDNAKEAVIASAEERKKKKRCAK